LRVGGLGGTEGVECAEGDGGSALAGRVGGSVWKPRQTGLLGVRGQGQKDV
jgi:hypothetical protein